MEKIFKWAKKAIKKMKVWDIGMLKILLLLIGVVIGAYFPIFVKQNLYIFIALIVILWVILGWKFYRK